MKKKILKIRQGIYHSMLLAVISVSEIFFVTKNVDAEGQIYATMTAGAAPFPTQKTFSEQIIEQAVDKAIYVVVFLVLFIPIVIYAVLKRKNKKNELRK